jgi:hypothetical protein
MLLARCYWAVCWATCSAAAVAASASASSQLWGAIRWDGFYNCSWDPNDVGRVTARVLQPPQWHDRLPWFAEVFLNGSVTFDSNNAATMAAEIEMAVAAGLSFWAFDVYPDNFAMSNSLHAYLNSSSAARANLSFCLVLQTSWAASGGLQAWGEKVRLYAAHFARAEYLLVLGNRPLVFLFDVYETAWGNATRPWSDWATSLEMLAAASLAAGLGRPYIALQTWSASEGHAQLSAINAAAGTTLVAALSSYALGGATDAGTPFSAFAAAGVAFWDALLGTGADVIPPVAAGWDQRPRVETPPPWVPKPDPAYVVMPTPAELSAFVAAGVEWLSRHRNATPARVGLVSAWNEYDEGHFIGAVLPEYGGNARLDAVGRALL